MSECVTCDGTGSVRDPETNNGAPCPSCGPSPCPACGHFHSRRFGGICVGCPCRGVQCDHENRETTIGGGTRCVDCGVVIHGDRPSANPAPAGNVEAVRIKVPGGTLRRVTADEQIAAAAREVDGKETQPQNVEVPEHMDVVKAWLAGIRHVLKCPGCPICRVPDDFEIPKEPSEDDEETLNESVEKGPK